MANDVFANGREISCKSGIGTSICAFPDVCMTPPENPATPPGVPIPYPNTGLDGDTTKGSKKVRIDKKEVMLKNKSYFKKSIGDEAGCAAKKGVITSVNRGKVYFIAWSMDVKFEGENVVRNLDMTTHNHASPVANAPAQIFTARMATANIPGCEKQRQDVETVCGPNGSGFSCPSNQAVIDAKANRLAEIAASKQRAQQAAAALGKTATKSAYKKDPLYIQANRNVDAAFEQMASDHDNDRCRAKMRCLLTPYDGYCCPNQTPHHLVEASSFTERGREQGIEKKASIYRVEIKRSLGAETEIGRVKVGVGDIFRKPMFGAEKYDPDKAPCVCAEGENQHQASHGLLHTYQNQLTRAAPRVHQPMNPAIECRMLRNAEECGAEAMVSVFNGSGCDKECIVAQLKKYHEEECEMAPRLPIRAVEA